VFVSIGCWTAIWWSPQPFVAFLLVILSTLGFGSGVLDGLIGGLFMSSEIRALKEFDWEIRNARRRAEERDRLGVEDQGKEQSLEDGRSERRDDGLLNRGIEAREKRNDITQLQC